MKNLVFNVRSPVWSKKNLDVVLVSYAIDKYFENGFNVTKSARQLGISRNTMSKLLHSEIVNEVINMSIHSQKPETLVLAVKDDTLKSVKAAYIEKALVENRFNQTKVSRTLGITRNTVRAYDSTMPIPSKTTKVKAKP